jgi:1,4-dihydroxy-2-naphthoate octaprenyltransferase
MAMRDDYSLKRAFRPFSYVVALASCGLGVALAWRDGYGDLGLAALLLCAGLLLQAGVNLVNDAGDLRLLDGSLGWHAAARRQIRRHYRWGLVCFAVATLIGLYFVWLRGWPLLLLGAGGIAGAFGYTTEPINYKRRGLAVLLVFWLMGVLMVVGCYFALAGGWRADVLLASLPLSCLVSLLLLANELRDLRVDAADGVGTLSVRLGEARARWLFVALLLAAYLLALVWLADAWLSLLLLISLPGLLGLCRVLSGDDLASLPPVAGRLLGQFAVACVLAVVAGG